MFKLFSKLKKIKMKTNNKKNKTNKNVKYYFKFVIGKNVKKMRKCYNCKCLLEHQRREDNVFLYDCTK